jgi:ribonuclease T1
VINNPKAARIIAAVVIAMLVITLAASLFGCSAAKPSASTDPASGLTIVAVADLPSEAQQTLKLIDQGGPYPYSRDGVVFGNFEKILPKQDRGYYHEYTVKTPGESDRGARRIVTGKNGERYYTDDHYKSFRRIAADGGATDD